MLLRTRFDMARGRDQTFYIAIIRIFEALCGSIKATIGDLFVATTTEFQDPYQARHIVFTNATSTQPVHMQSNAFPTHSSPASTEP